MEQQIAFYRLSRKIVHAEEDIPEDARQVMYYSLAIGHHVGVLDCFSELMAVPVQQYRQCLDLLPEGDARCKLEGVLKWDEIEINRSHVDQLLPALDTISSGMGGSNSQWVQTMMRCLREMVAEPAMYLMLRMRG